MRPATDRRVILVVDDDAAVLNSLKFALEIEGFRVFVFTSAEALLKEPELPASSCLIVDQNLPGRSGLELVAQLRQRDVRFPAILITSHPSLALRRQALTADVAVVEKPLLGNALSEAIGRALG